MNSSLPSGVGDLISHHRRLKGWTQEELSEKSEIPARTIQQIEEGKTKKPNSHTRKCLATALEIDENVLQEACRTGKASDTLHAANSPASNDTPVTKSNEVKPVIIAGKVLCANNEPVVGIWVDVFEGSAVNKDISGFADLRTPNSNGPEVTFVFVLQGDAYNLHVGCGGSKQHWKGLYFTEAGTGIVHDHEFHYFVCHNVAPGIDYGSCELQY